MTTVKSFVKQFVAQIKGDEVEVRAEKAFRQAQSALKSQIASLEGDTINKEEAVTEAKEKLTKSRINHGDPISNRNTYVENLLSAKNSLTSAESDLEKHNKKIAFLKEELTNLETDVEA